MNRKQPRELAIYDDAQRRVERLRCEEDRCLPAALGSPSGMHRRDEGIHDVGA